MSGVAIVSRITFWKIILIVTHSGSLASASNVWTRAKWWRPTCQDAGHQSITASNQITVIAVIAVLNSSLLPTSRWMTSTCRNLFAHRLADAAQVFANTLKGFYFSFFFVQLCSLSHLVYIWQGNKWLIDFKINCRVGLLPAVLDQNRYGHALKAHLRDSIRTNRTLQHHLSRETLPTLDNYQGNSVAARATLDELHLGADQGIQRVFQFFSSYPSCIIRVAYISRYN